MPLSGCPRVSPRSRSCDERAAGSQLVGELKIFFMKAVPGRPRIFFSGAPERGARVAGIHRRPVALPANILKVQDFRCAVKVAGQADFAPSKRRWSQARKASETLRNRACRSAISRFFRLLQRCNKPASTHEKSPAWGRAFPRVIGAVRAEAIRRRERRSDERGARPSARRCSCGRCPSGRPA